MMNLMRPGRKFKKWKSDKSEAAQFIPPDKNCESDETDDGEKILVPDSIQKFIN